jgi:hypothetical protein
LPQLANPVLPNLSTVAAPLKVRIVTQQSRVLNQAAFSTWFNPR